MEYYMYQTDCEFKVKKKNEQKILLVIKSLVGRETRGGHFCWVDMDFADLETIDEILSCWRWGTVRDVKTDEINSLDFLGEKLGDDLLLFKTIAPLVEPQSFIEMRGEDGSIWRWVFNGVSCVEMRPTIIWERR